MNKLILPAIHLIALLSFIVYKTKTPFVQFMQKRYQEVFDGLNRSKLQALEAEVKKKEVESKFASLESEKKRIALDWVDRQAQQTKAIRESTQRMMAQMKAESEQNKKALEQSYQQTILKNFTKTVLAQAEIKIKQTMTPEVQNNLNQRFVQEVSRDGGIQ